MHSSYSSQTEPDPKTELDIRGCVMIRLKTALLLAVSAAQLQILRHVII